MTELDLRIAWAAGFIDGEGCIGIYHTDRGGFKLRLAVTQRDRPPLEVLTDIFGGRGSLNRVQPPRRLWRWEVYSRQAAAILEDVEPFLVVKRAQAQLGIEFQKRRRSRPYEYTGHDQVWDNWAYREIGRLKGGTLEGALPAPLDPYPNLSLL